MSDYFAIIKRNLFTPIVIGIFILAAALIYVEEYRDAWFISVVIFINALIGIIQELRAKYALKKLELMSAPKARLIKGSKVVEADYRELEVGNEIELLAGDEVPSDGVVIDSRGLELNESMLTGESASVEKEVGESVYAATTVMAGSARVRLAAVGSDTKAGKISADLKRYTPELTPLQRAIQKAISALTFLAIGVAILIFITYYFSGANAVQILKTITSAAVSLVPEGLLLASSLLLAFGSLRLAQAKVLPQKLSAIEAMALLNVLCVDKTGTLTKDSIRFDRVLSFSDIDEDQLGSLAAMVAKEASGGNDTGRAIVSGLDLPTKYQVMEVMSFSSSRKMSGLRVKMNGRVLTLLLGAPEMVVRLATLGKAAKLEIDQRTARGQRVLIIAQLSDHQTPLKDISMQSGKSLGAIVLSNDLRSGVEKTVKYLQDRDVVIKVISGDNPQTVSYVAREAGIDNFDQVTTGAELTNLKGAEFGKVVDKHSIFARVLPEQKERLIKHFQKKGLFTGMVGDGVNDALALKRADLGVAMHSGAVVSRRVSDIVLLNNSFNALPLGLRLGNQIMQAIEVVATLFFHKIIYSVTLLLTAILIGMSYPFEPRHVTFMNIFLVTMPTIMWTLFPPVPRHRVNPARFWRDTLFAVAPIALVTGLTVTFTYWAMTSVYPDRPIHVATMTVLTATFFGVYMVFLVSKMLGVAVNKRSKRARLLYLSAVVFVALTSFSIGPLRDFFDFSAPTVWILWPALVVISLAAAVQWQMAKNAANKFKNSLEL